MNIREVRFGFMVNESGNEGGYFRTLRSFPASCHSNSAPFSSLIRVGYNTPLCSRGTKGSIVILTQQLDKRQINNQHKE